MNEREYDKLQNEGGEGYNPIREARIKREMEAEAARPKTIDEQMDAIRHQISVRDCSIARESGTFDQAEIDQLRTTLKELEDKKTAEFLATWTLAVTKERRIRWNDFVRSVMDSAGRISPDKSRELYKKQHNQGWMLADLKRAVKIHKL